MLDPDTTRDVYAPPDDADANAVDGDWFLGLGWAFLVGLGVMFACMLLVPGNVTVDGTTTRVRLWHCLWGDALSHLEGPSQFGMKIIIMAALAPLSVAGGLVVALVHWTVRVLRKRTRWQ